MPDILASLQGLTANLEDLVQQVGQLGWEVKHIKYDKKKGYLVKAKNPHGEEIESFGDSEKRAMAKLLLSITRKYNMRTAAQWKLGMWNPHNWTDQLPQIAEAYSKANIYDPKAAAAFHELGQDSVRRYNQLKQHLNITETDDPEPYRNAQEMIEDIQKRRKLNVSRANSDHPIWDTPTNVAFRAVHDVLGHAVSGGNFDWQGENAACAAHFPLLSENAQKALWSECIGQTGYAAHYKGFGPLKVALFPQFMDSVQQKENPGPGYAGVHPSQSFPPVSSPAVKPEQYEPEFDGIPPHLDGLGLANYVPGVDRPIHIFSASTSEISRTAFQLISHNKKGVFINLKGDQPKHGYAFSPTKDREVQIKFANLDPQKIDEFVQTNLAALSMPDNYLSIWKNGSKAYLDIGQIMHDFHEAHKRAWDNEQETMWDLDRDEEIEVRGKKEKEDDDISKEGSARFSSPFTDPNANWSSGVEPMQPNAYLDHGDPLGSQAGADNAKLIDTEWSQLNQEDPGELALMKQAIVNAFRAVLLSPRKDLKANVRHYQDIAGIPGDVSDPGVYWNTLENARQNHNVKVFGEQARFAHMVYAPFVKPFESIIFQMNPKIGWQGAQKKAKQIMFDWQNEEQERIAREDKDKPQDKQRLADEIERRANEALAKRMQLYIKEFQPKLDFTSAVQEPLFAPPEATPQDVPEKYPAWMGTHLKAIGQISGHVDNILKAALEDIHEHDGTGHHFRAAVMQLGVSGVGPKVCSFAWLLLQPMTSQLATIDTHMMDVLGHNYEKDMNTRDYGKFERELATGRDAAGYGHIPLGQFQWLMWDAKRTGAGSHQDHSGLKVLNPTPHDSIDWAAKVQPVGGGHAEAFKADWHNNAPDWWRNTQPYRDSVAADWDQNVAPFTPKNQIPYGATDPTYQFTSKTAASLRRPWYTNPDTGLHTYGNPGETNMQHATRTLQMSTPQVWSVLGEDQAGKE